MLGSVHPSLAAGAGLASRSLFDVAVPAWVGVAGPVFAGPIDGEGLVHEPDWTTLGLILAIVGSFLLANAILFRNPRALVREHYGVRRVPLRTIREFIFHRLQMTLGFAFLLSGFALQLVGRLRPLPVATFDLDGTAVREFPLLWIGLILLVAILLEVGGWWWSLRAFRAYVRDHLRENPPDFATDVHTAREVGELFGLRPTADETVQSYVARVRHAVGIAPRPGVAPAVDDDEDFALGPLEPAFDED